MKDEYQRLIDAMTDDEWDEYQAGQPDDAEAMDRAFGPVIPTEEELDRMAREFFERHGPPPF